MSTLPIDIDSEVLAAQCRQTHIRRLAVFGSALRPDFRPASDADLLVEFEPGRVPGSSLFRIRAELSGLLGRQVDLETAGTLCSRFRREVMAEAVTVYDAA